MNTDLSTWTFTSGSSGTVDLLTTSCTTPTYDFTTVPDHLAMQVENNTVALREDYTLADNKGIVIKLYPSVNASGNSLNEVNLGISLNYDDSNHLSYAGGGRLLLEFQSTSDGWRIYADGRGASGGLLLATGFGESSKTECIMNGHAVYLRIVRSGLKYACYCSFTGKSWVPIKEFIADRASAFSNVWVHASSGVLTGSKILPVQLVEWIKEVDNSVFSVN